jgi:hypothetical protein
MSSPAPTAPTPTEPPKGVDPEYRQWLVVAELKAQDDYDKTLVTLSGGALAISFAFVKDIVGTGGMIHSWMLVTAWISWGLSSAVVLVSYYVSRLALRKAIKQCDDNSIHDCRTPGSFYTYVLRVLNLTSGALFLLGVLAMAGFVYANVSREEMQRDRQEAADPAISAVHAVPTEPANVSQRKTGPGSAGLSRERLRTAADQEEVDSARVQVDVHVESAR